MAFVIYCLLMTELSFFHFFCILVSIRLELLRCVNREYPPCGCFLSLVLDWSLHTIRLRASVHWWATRVAKHVSDLGNRHNNGPHQDQIFHNPSALCSAVLAKNWIWLHGGLMRPTGSLQREWDSLFSFFFFLFCPLNLPYLRSSRSKYLNN